MLTLKQSMELAGKNTLNSLSCCHDYLPYWSVNIDREKQCTHKMENPAHNIGRWWDAMLRVEAATGFAIPSEMETGMLRHLKSCLDNPFSVCGYVLQKPVGWIDLHSQREVLLALACLVRYRNHRWAAEQGGRMVRALNRYILDDGNWDISLIEDLARQGGVAIDSVSKDPLMDADCAINLKRKGVELTASHGRMLEGLLEFYLITGDEVAMQLADRLARFHFNASTLSNGLVPEANGYVHTHSLFGTYRGLLMYGRMTRQHEYIERIAKTYSVTVRTRVKQSGFISHDWGSDTRGETTSPGDAAQLALWLAQLGYSEFLDDAERIVRARILPSQIAEPLGFTLAVNDGEDEHGNGDDLVVGAFGGMHRHPHGGKHPTTDITTADLHTLCDIYTHIVEETAMGLVLNFHFDFEDSRIRIGTSRDEVGCLNIQPKTAQSVFIRMPKWTPVESIRVTVNGKAASKSWVGQFLYIKTQEEKARIQVEYDLPVIMVDETTNGVDYHFKWRGDDVVGITPNTDFLPFYPSLCE